MEQRASFCYSTSALIPMILRRAKLEPNNLGIVVDVLGLLVDRRDPEDLRSYASAEEALAVVEFLLGWVKELGARVMSSSSTLQSSSWEGDLSRLRGEDLAEQRLERDVRLGEHHAGKDGPRDHEDRGGMIGEKIAGPQGVTANMPNSEDHVLTLRKICKCLFHAVRTDKTSLLPFVQTHRWVAELERRTRDPTIKTYLGMLVGM